MHEDRSTAFVLIVEDHPLVADSLLACVRDCDAEIEVSVAQSLHAALRLIDSRQAPLMIITDLALTDTSGIESVKSLRKAAPKSALLVVTAFDDPVLKAEARALGAIAYIVKSTSIGDLRAEIRKVLGAREDKGAALRPRQPAPDGILTPKQLSVLEELAAGRSNKEIARRMKISDDTVASHVKEIFSRLSVRNRTEAVVRYFQLGLRHHNRPAS